MGEDLPVKFLHCFEELIGLVPLALGLLGDALCLSMHGHSAVGVDVKGDLEPGHAQGLHTRGRGASR